MIETPNSGERLDRPELTSRQGRLLRRRTAAAFRAPTRSRATKGFPHPGTQVPQRGHKNEDYDDLLNHGISKWGREGGCIRFRILIHLYNSILTANGSFVQA